MSLNMIRYVICILVIGQVLVQSYRLLRGQPMHRCSTTACFSSNQIAEPLQELKKSLMREYSSFFNPMDRRFYSSDVEFVDPMTSFRGIDKYQNNVDMLAGRKGGIGKLLFRDASIILHNIRVMGSKELETRWTLQVSVRVPGSPRAKFTGVSRYSLDDNGLIAKQVDFWDSVNLVNGNYQTKPITEGLKDFFGQLQGETGAVQSAPELPVRTLLCCSIPLTS